MASKTTALVENVTPVDGDLLYTVDDPAGTPISKKLKVDNLHLNYLKGKNDLLYQPLDADLTAIAALTTTAGGRSALALADPGVDRLLGWDDSAGSVVAFALADIATEAAPAAGDFVTIYGAEGDLRKVNWSSLPGAAGGLANIVEDLTPQLGGQLDINTKSILWPSTVALADFLDEDAMTSNSATAGATQQSIKAYVDAALQTAIASDLYGINVDRTAASETLADTDQNSVVSMNSGSAQTLTIPPDEVGVFDYPVGGHTIVYNEGVGLTTLAQGAGVTIRALGSTLVSPGQYAICVLYNIATNVWIAQWHANSTAVGTVDTSGTPIANDFARFTDANTIEGRDATEVKTDLGLVIGTNVLAYDADVLFADVGDTFTAGYLSDSYDGGNITTGTVTPAPATGQENFQHYTNNGAHTLAPPTSPCSVIVEITNGATAGAITTSGFTKVRGDAFTTTNTHKFQCTIVKTNSVSSLYVEAMQ